MKEGERELERKRDTPDLTSQSANPCFLSSFFILVLPSPLFIAPRVSTSFFGSVFSQVRVATIPRLRLFLAIGERGARPRLEEGQRPRRVFSNPSAFKYSYQFHPFAPRSFKRARPLELASVDQRTDTNRGCIQRAFARALSNHRSTFHLVSSVDVHSFSHPGTGSSLSLC